MRFKPIYYGWWVVLACFFCNMFVMGIVHYAPTALFEPLQKEFMWSHSQISSALSLRGVELGLFSPLVGFAVDMFGIRRLLTAGMWVVCLGLILLSYVNSMVELYIAIFVLAIGGSLSSGLICIVAISQWFDEKNIGRTMGITMTGAGAGGLLVPFVVMCIDRFGWRSASMLLAGLVFIISLPLALVIKPPPASVTFRSLTGEKSLGGKPPSIRDQSYFFRHLKSLSYFYINIGEMARFCAISSVVTHVVPFLNSIDIPRSKASIIAAMIPVLSILGRFMGGIVSDFMDKRRFMTFIYLIMASGLLAFSKSNGSLFLFLFLLFFPLGWGGGAVGRALMIRQLFGHEFMGRLVGINMCFGAIGGIIGVSAAGLFYDKFGIYEPFWTVLSIFILFVTLLNERIKVEKE